MLVEEQRINVKVTNKTEKHFQKLGYDVKNGCYIDIPIEHLTSGSGLKVLVICDYCNDIFEKQWRKHLISKDDCCQLCKTKKMMNTSLKRYGNVCSLQNIEIHKKVKETNIKRYGVEYPLQNEDIRKKTVLNVINKSFYNRITTKQQTTIHNIFGGEMNYCLYPYFVDIYFEKDCIFFEYDGGGHNLRVKFGKISQKNFDKNEKKRTSFLKSLGLKEFRIIDSSKKGNLPSKEKLIEIKNKAFIILKQDMFSTYIYNLDNNTETYY